MAFQLKDFKSITASMINWIRGNTTKITDFNIGSTARTLVEAPAIEMDQLYQEFFHGIKEAIPVATYRSFDFTKEPATSANGLMTFYASGGQTTAVAIPAGTVVKNPSSGILYKTSLDASIPVGQTSVTVLTVATTTGYNTNSLPLTITQLISPVDGVIGVTNVAPFNNGTDLETEAEQKVRFIQYITTLARGTIAALKYGATTVKIYDNNGIVTEEVASVATIEPYVEDPALNNPGTVNLYVHNGSGGTSVSLVSKVQKVIDGYYDDNGVAVPGWKSAGVTVNCYAAAERLLSVTAQITLLSGYNFSVVQPLVISAISYYLSSLPIGEKALVAEIVQRIMDVDGVYNVVVSAPTVDFTVGKSEKVMPNVLTVTEAA